MISATHYLNLVATPLVEELKAIEGQARLRLSLAGEPIRLTRPLAFGVAVVFPELRPEKSRGGKEQQDREEKRVPHAEPPRVKTPWGDSTNWSLS